MMRSLSDLREMPVADLRAGNLKNLVMENSSVSGSLLSKLAPASPSRSGFLVLVFRQAAGKLKNWTETASGAMTVAALLGCMGILVHSFLDFNLRIPAHAALFYVLCAIAASAPRWNRTVAVWFAGAV